MHTVDGDTWVFELVARPVKWEILPDVRVTAWTYNGTVPGPEIRVPYGQKVRVIVKSELPDPTAVHWHGSAVPNAMDGVPGVAQDPIAPGETFTYAFRALPTSTSSRGGTFMYHSHFDEDRQVGLGLSAPFVIEPEAEPAYDLERTVLLGEWNLDAASGDTEVVAKDGVPLATPYEADVVDVAPGERYDLLFTADKPGKWVFHCHIGHHLTNDGEGPGGLLTVVDVAERKGRR